MVYDTPTKKLWFICDKFNLYEEFREALSGFYIGSYGIQLTREFSPTLPEVPIYQLSKLYLISGETGETIDTAHRIYLQIHSENIEPFFYRVIIRKGESTFRLATHTIEAWRKMVPGPTFIVEIHTEGGAAYLGFLIEKMSTIFPILEDELGPFPEWGSEVIPEQAPWETFPVKK